MLKNLFVLLFLNLTPFYGYGSQLSEVERESFLQYCERHLEQERPSCLALASDFIRLDYLTLMQQEAESFTDYDEQKNSLAESRLERHLKNQEEHKETHWESEDHWEHFEETPALEKLPTEKEVFYDQFSAASMSERSAAGRGARLIKEETALRLRLKLESFPHNLKDDQLDPSARSIPNASLIQILAKFDHHEGNLGIATGKGNAMIDRSLTRQQLLKKITMMYKRHLKVGSEPGLSY